MTHTTGLQRITATFDRIRTENRAALIPYLTLGYPTPARSLALVEAVVRSGADLVELGIPFSDPLADGPVIQRATHAALERGMTLAHCLELAQALRQRGITTPFLFMGYYNPILTYGEESFCQACQDGGIDGLIVPDLPPEEGESLEEACRWHGLALVYLLAPTSPTERVRLVCQRSQGFVYLVSITGTTGPRAGLSPALAGFVERVRAVTDKPLAVGFGISTPAQARQVAALADGVIVGSALVRLVEGINGEKNAATFIAELREAVASR